MSPRHARLGLQRLAPLPLQLLLVPQQSHQVLGLLPDVDALVTSVSVYVLKVSQCLDGVNVLPALPGHALGAGFDQVVQQGERLVNMAPVFTMVVKSLPDHAHDLSEGHHIKGQVCDFRHERAGRAPGIVGGGLTDLDLGLRVVVDHVFHLPSQR